MFFNLFFNKNSFRKKIYFIISLFFLITFFSISNSAFVFASAGIRGPSLEERTFLFKPGLEISKEFEIYGSNHLEAYIGGDLAKFAKLIDNNPNSGKRKISFKLKLPSSLTPGIHYLYVGAKESAPKNVMMGGQAAAQMMIRVINLYEKPYLEAKLKVEDAGEGKNTKGELSIISYSKSIINNIDPLIKIFYNNKSATNIELKLNPIDAAPLQENKIRFLLPSASLKKGLYIAKALISYSGKESLASTSFRIGSKTVSLNKYSKRIEANKINKLSFLISNEWNEPVEVYANIYFNNELYGTSPTVKLSKFGQNNFFIFLDAKGFSLGNKKGTLEVVIDDSIKKNFLLDFNVTALRVEETDINQEKPSLINNSLVNNNYLLLIYGIIILLVIIIIILLLKSNGGEKEFIIK